MNSPRPVTKAVFPVAGMGTRFLPATKSIPKEMLPVVDKPLIQYAVEEAIEAGIDTLVIITRGDKQAISDHFRASPELESFLESRGKQDVLQAVRDILPSGVKMEEAIQHEPLGLGHAVLCARHIIKDEPFAVLLPDDMVKTSGVGTTHSMVQAWNETGASQVGVEEIPLHLSPRYGMAAVEKTHSGHLRISELVEKPAPEEAPSNLGVVGRYVLDGRIFSDLENIGAGAGGEIQLTDAIVRLMNREAVHAFTLTGERYDCGSRLGFLRAQIDYALDQADLAEPLLQQMRKRVQRHSDAS